MNTFIRTPRSRTLSVGEMMHELILTIKCAEFNFFIWLIPPYGAGRATIYSFTFHKNVLRFIYLPCIRDTEVASAWAVKSLLLKGNVMVPFCC